MRASSATKTIFGYEILDQLGEGAGSKLYVVSEPKTRQLFAMKHVVPRDDKFPRYFVQLQNEFNVSKLFRHNALRKSIDLQIRKKLFAGVVEAALVMELVDGISLDGDKPSTMPLLVDCFLQTATALSAMHGLQLCHCDLKPSNIIRQPDGTVKLIDFGQTCRLGTVKSRVQGTPDYIAPEQVRLNPVGAFTDVYNLGATLYWGLTGKKVPTLMNVSKRDRNVVREQLFPRPAELDPNVPRELSDFVMECLHVNPSARPQTMTHVIRVLTPHGLNGQATPQPAPARVQAD